VLYDSASLRQLRVYLTPMMIILAPPPHLTRTVGAPALTVYRSPVCPTLRSSALRAVCFYPVVFDETYVVPQILPARIPLPRSPLLLLMPTAIVSTSPHGSTPSICSDLRTISSEKAPSERPESERPSALQVPRVHCSWDPTIRTT
jgi:hypothetical protein